VKKITNITNEAHQQHIIPLNDSEIIFNLRFYPTIQQWCFDVEWQDHVVTGVKLSVGVLHITNTNLPFDFVITDESLNGLDPFQIGDFESGRCNLYILNPVEMETYRGVPVAI